MVDLLPTTINLGADIEDLKRGVAQVTTTSDTPYVRINKQHVWTIRQPGGDSEALPEGCLFVARVDSPDSFVTEWGNRTKGAKMMRPLSQGMLEPEDLKCILNKEAPGHKISQGVGINLLCVYGPLAGMPLRYETDAKFGISAVKKLTNEYINNAGRNPSPLLPVISLEVDIIHLTGYGESHKPRLEVHYWDTPELHASREKLAGIEHNNNQPVNESAPPPSVRHTGHEKPRGYGAQ